MKQTKPTTKEAKYTQREIDDALWDFEDISNFASVKIFLDGDTLRAVKNGEDIKTPIEIGVRQTYMTGYAKKAFEQNFPDLEYHQKGKVNWAEFTHKGVPFKMTIYSKNHNYLIRSLDSKVYKYDQYAVPNNIDSFLKIRGLLA